MAADEGSPFVVPIKGGKLAEVEMRVPAGDVQRLIFGSVRSTARLERVEIVDPSGRSRWMSDGSKALKLPRAEAIRPEWGEMYFVPALAGVESGRWRLRFMASVSSDGTIRGAYAVRPRFELMLPVSWGEASVGVPTTVDVIPSDNGQALAKLAGVDVWVEDSAGIVVARELARGSIRTVLGVDVDLPPGQYTAVVRFAKPGRYVVKARHSFKDQGGSEVLASRVIDVK